MKCINHKTLLYLLISIGLFISCTTKENKEPWVELFNGKDLSGWIQKGGEAKFEVENGEIVGKTVLESPNSFLCSENDYSDFILEYEVKGDARLNSGVQFRSLSSNDYNEGRVHGYQCELDPSDRAWSGGIYDEARRGWLYPLSYNETAKTAYKIGEWNKFRIEAIGDTIRTFVNGIPVANLLDKETQSGFFGLQVHSVPNKEGFKDIEIRWKNIRIITENPEKYMQETSAPEVSRLINELTEKEQADGWKLLFDGKSTNNFRGAHKDSFPSIGWKVENGELIVQASDGAESQHGGDIVTIDQYSKFDLIVEFKITEGANSGIKYYVTENEETSGSAIGLEFQVLDDNKHPDAKLGNHEGSRTVASLYDLIKAENKRFTGVGNWNQARIISDGTHVEHWLNNFKVLEYERGSDEYRQLVAESKYKKWKNFGEAEKGHILLQDHGDEVAYRNIKIKVLD